MQHLESEMSVLGACLLDGSVFDDISGLLCADDFANDTHRAVFSAIAELSRDGKPIDPVTVNATLPSVRYENLIRMVDVTPCPELGLHYAKEVKDRALVRRINHAAHNIITKAKEGMKGDDLANYAEAALFDLRNTASKGPRHIKEALRDAFRGMEDAVNNKGKVHGIPTGFPSLDCMFSGLREGKLYILAARPAMGKTAIAMNIIEHAAVQEGFPCLGFSMEMTDRELAEREICALSRVDANRARLGTLDASDFSKLSGNVDRLHRAPIWIDETESNPIAEIRSIARRWKRKHGKGLVVVDYLQLAKGTGQNREQEIADISRNLKGMAKELGVPVLALSQLNRGLENRADKRPIMADLRESGSIEQDADAVMFLYREAVYCEACKVGSTCSKDHQRKAELIIGKNRGGPIGIIPLVWMAEHTRFENEERRREYR